MSIRSNLELEGMAAPGRGALINGLRRISRVLKEDVSWRVEVYDGQEFDQSSLPAEHPNRVLVVDDCEAAAVVGEQVCRTLATDGISAVPGTPPSGGRRNDLIRRPRTFESPRSKD